MAVVKCLIKGPFIRQCGKSSERILKFLQQTRFGGGLGNGRKINIFVVGVGVAKRWFTTVALSANEKRVF